MGGTPSKQREEELTRQEEKREHQRNEAVDRLRQAIYGGNIRIPAQVQSLSEQRDEERKRKEDRRQQERNEAADRLRMAIYEVYSRLPAEIELLLKQEKEEEEIERKEGRVGNKGKYEESARLTSNMVREEKIPKEAKRQLPADVDSLSRREKIEQQQEPTRPANKLYGKNSRPPAKVELLSKQGDKMKSKEEKCLPKRNEASDRLMQAILSRTNATLATKEQTTWKEETTKQEAQNERVDRLKQNIYGEYPRFPLEVQRQMEQQKRRLEAERLQHEELLAFQSFMKLQWEKRERKITEQAFLGRLKRHKVTKNLDLLNDFRKAFNLTSLSCYPDKPYTETDLQIISGDYIRASTAFKRKNKQFTISRITRVDNTFHVLQYMLMKDKYRNCFDDVALTENLMFHGTKSDVLDSICTYNFDRSKIVTHKFGHGISFARDPYYATHFPRENRTRRRKVMVITQMFWGKLDLGTKDMDIPSRSSYTSANADRTVIVKFDDASFYPLYIVYYTGLDYKYRKW